MQQNIDFLCQMFENCRMCDKKLDFKLGTDGINEVVEAVFDRLEQRTGGGGGCEYFDSCFVALDVEVGIHHAWFAIDVHHGGFGAEDGKLFGAEAVYVGVFLDLLGQ